MKARNGCALGLLAGVFLIGSVQAQSVVIGPQAGSIAVVQGASVTVPIVADMTGSGGRSLGSVAAQLVWRPGVLSFRGVGAGALGAPTINADSAAGTLRFALANPTGVTGQSVLLNAVFAVVGAPGANDTLRLTLSELTNAGTFADLLSIGQEMNASVCVSTGLFGDLNAGGTIDAFDALIILTNAVGLPIAPNTTVNGDVDGDGSVSTRDALVVLSYAVGLPVGGFRVSQMNPGLCTIRTAASVQLAPRTITVTSGDRVVLTAVVRDSAGATIQGTGLLWTSADTTVVKTDAAGNVVAMNPGSTRVYANVAPGLKDSVTVSVDATRHVWYVDQSLAARNSGVELGSSLYPFSGIAQAVTRAAPFDTIRIAPASYGEGARLAKPLTLIGDSTAAGVTTIRNATGAGIFVDSLASGFVRIEKLRIEDAQGGVVVRGADSVLLSRVAVLRSRGVGISVSAAGRLVLDHVAVMGAVHQGIEVVRVLQPRLHAVVVDLVAELAPLNTLPLALRIASADSVAADSLSVATAGVRLDTVRAASVSLFSAQGTVGAALGAIVAERFALDGADIRGASAVDTSRGESPYATVVGVSLGGASGTALIANARISDNGRPALGVGGGDSVLVSHVEVRNSPSQPTALPWTVAFNGQRRVAIEYSTFADNNGAHVGFEHYEGLMTASVDTSVFQGTALRGQHLVAMDVRRSQFRNTTESAVEADNVGSVSLVRLDIGTMAVEQDDYEYGGPFAVDVSEATSLYFDSLQVHDNPFGAVICRYCGDVQGMRSLFTNNGSYVWTGGKFGATVTTLAFESPARAWFRNLLVDGGGDIGLWLRTSLNGSGTFLDSSIVAGQLTLVQGDGPYYPAPGDSLVVTNSMLRGRDQGGSGVNAFGLGAFRLRRTLLDSLYIGVNIDGPGQSTVQESTIRVVGWYAVGTNGGPVLVDADTIVGCSSGGIGVKLYAGSATVSRNLITGCAYGVFSQTDYTAGVRVAVLGNTIVRDTTDSGPAAAISINQSYDSVIVAGNQILGGRGRGVELMASYYGISGARVDSNFVQGVLTEGVGFGGVPFTGPVAMRYNTLADNNIGLYSQVTVQGAFNTVVRNALYGVLLDASSGASAFRRANFVGNPHWALFNNYVPYVLADSSYWGDPLGPRCSSGCNPASTGDSVNTLVTYMNVDTALVVAAPPIPAPLPAAVFRSARPATVARPREGIDRPRPPVTLPLRRVQP